MVGNPVRFDYAISFVLKHEGGYVNNPSDPGGATNYGVSLRFLKAAGIDIDGDDSIDINDIHAMDKTRARAIYKEHWWDKYGYEQIQSLKISAKVLDMAVWMGPSRAHKILQIAMNRIIDKPISVDGDLGPQSLAALNKLIHNDKGITLLAEIKNNIEHFIINLCADKPSLNGFKKGWLKRAME